MDREFMLEKFRELRKNMTDVEKIFWNEIRNKKLGFKFRRQVVFENKYIVDFCCYEKKIIVELDGGQHCENEKDLLRDAGLNKLGFRVIRFWNNEVLENLDGCLEILKLELEK